MPRPSSRPNMDLSALTDALRDLAGLGSNLDDLSRSLGAVADLQAEIDELH